MESIITNFHFLRPLWLLGCLPALILFGMVWFIQIQSSLWSKTIDRSLLPFLLDKKQGRRQGWPLLVLLLAWLLACLSLAGPVWKQLPQPVLQRENALVLIQDLSLSFYAQDLTPNRLTRAQHKLQDILDARTEGTTALVVYSGDAHIVAPLTDDSTTIAAMVPALSPGIMPSYGSNVTEAVELALQLFKGAGIGLGKILLLTDEVTGDDAKSVTKQLQGKNIILAVLGIGTRDGGPIPKSDGGFLKDEEENIIIPRLNSSVLADLAESNGGQYREITLDDTDIGYLLQTESLLPAGNSFKQVDREFDQWEEMGPLLLLVIVPLALLAFRRGWILAVIFAVMLSGQQSHAMSWEDLWQRKDQQGAKALSDKNPQQAAELFTSPQWKGIAEYQAGNYGDAIESFSLSETANGQYNRGNGLAKSGKLAEAVKAYEEALRIDPSMGDAKANKELVQKLLKQQQEQQQQNNQDNEQEQKSDDGNQQKDSQGKDQSDQPNGQDQQSGDENTQRENSGQQEKQSAGSENTEETAHQDEQTSADEKKGTLQEKSPEEGENSEQQAKDGEGKKSTGNHEDQLLETPDQIADEALSDEEKQALEQWLRQVPDNPGGLLKRKFEYEYRKNRGVRQADPNKKIW